MPNSNNTVRGAEQEPSLSSRRELMVNGGKGLLTLLTLARAGVLGSLDGCAKPSDGDGGDPSSNSSKPKTHHKPRHRKRSPKKRDPHVPSHPNHASTDASSAAPQTRQTPEKSNSVKKLEALFRSVEHLNLPSHVSINLEHDKISIDPASANVLKETVARRLGLKPSKLKFREDSSTYDSVSSGAGPKNSKGIEYRLEIKRGRKVLATLRFRRDGSENIPYATLRFYAKGTKYGNSSELTETAQFKPRNNLSDKYGSTSFYLNNQERFFSERSEFDVWKRAFRDTGSRGERLEKYGDTGESNGHWVLGEFDLSDHLTSMVEKAPGSRSVDELF